LATLVRFAAGRGLLAVAGGLVLLGCTDYRSVHWGGLVPWEQARKAIYQETGESSRRVPESGRHLVMPGETVSELAVLYRVPARDIVALNRLQPPYHIYVGQVLRLPQADGPGPADGLHYVVARGDTLSGIAAAHSVRLGDLVALNGTVDPERLHVGTTLRLPAGAAPTGTPPAPTSPAEAPRTQIARVEPAPRPAPASQVEPASEVAAARAPTPTPGATATPPVVRPAAPPQPAVAVAVREPGQAERDAARQRDLAAVDAPPLSGEGFLWPVERGEVIGTFGSKPDGRRNDGINIAAPAGSIVRAAENGLVVYADEDLAAFGRMLLIRHADGYLSAYAHNDALLVTRGDLVTRGQPIAKVGRSGDVVEPQLHFEIRQGKSPIDPVAMLGEGEISLARRD
jgi:murein DD-endopeptidase MepM/ murein hydrolase activator NlpD